LCIHFVGCFYFYKKKEKDSKENKKTKIKIYPEKKKTGVELIVNNSVDLMANVGHLLLSNFSRYHIILFIRYVFLTSECLTVKKKIFGFKKKS
jgi:hypothetical protein